MIDKSTQSTDASNQPEPISKILFLDVDGVLNTTRSRTLLALSKGPLRQLSRIVQATGCKIVLSSTWRLADFTRKRLANKLRFRGLFIFSRTPLLSTSSSRGDEIAAWLHDEAPPGLIYAIVDDDGDMQENQLPNFFQTKEESGLTPEIADRIIAHLNRHDT